MAQERGEEVVRYVEQRALAEVQHDNKLALVGFSTQLPTNLRRLNDTLVSLDRVNNFQGLSIRMIPDSEQPMLVAETTYSSNREVTLDIKRNVDMPEASMAKLQIGGGRASVGLCFTTIDYLRQYIHDLHSEDVDTVLVGEPTILEKEKGESETIRVNFNELSPALLGDFPLRTYELQLADSNSPLFKLRIIKDRGINEPLLRVLQIEYSGPSPVVERVIQLATDFIEKNPYTDPKYFNHPSSSLDNPDLIQLPK